MRTPQSIEMLWNKYRHEGDENTPDRMFYENFVDAITEAIAEAEEDIDLLTEEIARLREDVENARAEERERVATLELELERHFHDYRLLEEKYKALQDKK